MAKIRDIAAILSIYGNFNSYSKDITALQQRVAKNENEISAVDIRTGVNENDITSLKSRTSTLEGKINQDDFYFKYAPIAMDLIKGNYLTFQTHLSGNNIGAFNGNTGTFTVTELPRSILY